MTLPGFYAVLDADVAARHGWTLPDLAGAVLDGGCRLLQLRAKSMAGGPLLHLADRLVAMASARGAHLIVNDRADVALLSGAAGVHVGQDDLAADVVRRLVGAHALVGWSTHTLGQVHASRALPISYLAVGPVFGTTTKETGYDAVGLDLVRVASRSALPGEVPRPVVAIGGVTLERAPAALAAGAASVAVLGDLFTGGDPSQRASAFVRAVGASGAAL